MGFLATLTALIYYFSNPRPQYYYDYTFRVAANILGGSVAFAEKQPSWLNEFVPFEGFYYSVFPFGSVVTMMPVAVFKTLGAITDMPAAFIAASCAAASVIFLYLISKRYDVVDMRRWMMIAGILFGTWTWTNLTMAGAWQLALGFAMAAELGAIYFTVYNRRPLIAGLFFAIAFGNRTEVLLTAPIFFYLLVRSTPRTATASDGRKSSATGGNLPAHAGGADKTNGRGAMKADSHETSVVPRLVAAFCVAPFILGVLTLVYNYVRFRSFLDFGYARIPGVLNEPWYNHGIFSYHYIPRQMWEMLWRPWETRGSFPYIVPNGFSSSVLWSSPFLLFSIRFGARDKLLKYASWAAIVVLCILLWTHGNSGGWQFGYRYAIVCLPWIFVLLLESASKRISPLEWAAYTFSIAANLYATWLFHWTDYLKP